MTTNDIRKAIVLMKSLKDVKVYMELLSFATSSTGDGTDKNIVVLSPERRKRIAAVAGVGLNNIPKHLSSLKALGLISGERNDYTLNKPSIIKQMPTEYENHPF